jgi:hypothetical protein
MQVNSSLIVSAVALVLSIVSIYLQWFRVQGAKVNLLNPEGDFRSILHDTYDGLPQEIQKRFPCYQEKYSGHTLIRLVFGNSGDRPGLVKIVKVEAQNLLAPGCSTDDKIKASFYNFRVIPEYSIILQEIVLRNIPPVDKETILDVAVRIECGGLNPKKRRFQPKDIECTLKVTLFPSQTNDLRNGDERKTPEHSERLEFVPPCANQQETDLHANKKTLEQSLEGLRHEYSELNQNFRHYSALRFAILTVYFAVIAGLASVAFGITKVTLDIFNQAAKLGGLFVTLVFFVFEVILERYLTHFSKVITQLEKSLGYSQLSSKPRSRFLKTRYATWGLFTLLALFWIYVVLR